MPGQEWRTFWESAIEWKNGGLPDVYDVFVKYETDVGQRSLLRKRRREVQLTYRIDWSESRGALTSEEYSVHHAVKALREIRDLIKSLKKAPGLPVVVRDAEAVEAARRKEMEEALAQHEEIKRQVLPSRSDDNKHDNGS